ncbi:MAG: PLP-dependent aminotransferase family protein [Comamonadaceae bacterium]|nr:PLP-dependent aminotransferase family protein [Comamonadaceae bacterium]
MELPVSLDPSRRHSLQRQLFDQLRGLILGAGLAPGTTFPPSRSLARQLGVSRNTVMLAYERLSAEGYLQTRSALGTFVSFDLPERSLQPAGVALAHAAPAELRRPAPPIAFQGRAQAVVNRERLEIDFWLGKLDPCCFPLATWCRLARRVLETSERRFAEYRDPAGAPELRRAIAHHLALARGMRVDPEQNVVAAGSQEGLNIVARLLLREGGCVAMENPSYQGAAYLFESWRAQILPVPVDEDGLCVDALPPGGPAFVYLTPSHQYPMGFTLSLERRLRLLDWARRHGAYVVEDDYDSDFRYRGSPLTALMGLDDAQCVIYVGTFSKSIGAGLRLGYLVLPPHLVEAARTVKALLDNGHPWLEQAVLAEFLSSGAYDAHLRKIRRTYLARRDCLIECLRSRFGAVALSGTESGMHLAWHLPGHWPRAPELQRLAADRGVGIYSLHAGAAHDFGGCAYSERTLFLGYSSLGEAHIRAGIERVADALGESMHSRKATQRLRPLYAHS